MTPPHQDGSQGTESSSGIGVSFILTCYNHARYAEQALGSILSQTHRPSQLIVTDDASTDESVEVIEAWIERYWPEAIFIGNQENRGLTATLNEAVPLVSGDAVAIMSADDWMADDRIAKQALILLNQPEIAMVHSDVLDVDSNGVPLRFGSDRIGDVETSGDLFMVLLGRNVISAPSVMLRTDVLRSAGPYDESLSAEDYDMWLRLSRTNRWAYIPEPLINYRRHADATTKSRDYLFASREQKLTVLRKHLGVNAEADRLIASQLRELVIRLYEWGRSPALTASDLGEIRSIRATPRLAFYWLVASLRVPGRRVQQLRAAVLSPATTVKRLAGPSLVERRR